MSDALPAGLTLSAPITPDQAGVLTPEALAFVADLHRRFNPRRLEVLAAREARQLRLDAGEKPDFLSETAHIRAADWKVVPPKADLNDRRVEITGPVDRKMIINALNSGAKVFMADFEDASSPSWANMVAGQQNLSDAVRRTITLEQGGKSYRLNERTATLLVRPRGWHLPEKHVMVDGQIVSGSLFDFGLYFFHNAAELLSRGSGPYFYLPKMESHLEARLWNDVFNHAEDTVGVPRSSIRATCLIETILAAFEMDEILYELREHSAGLNCGRWDYIFSIIKKFREDPAMLLPGRAQVTMEAHMMRSYSRLAIQTCHKRGAHAIGGMSAFIPVKNDEAANARAFDQVRRDKQREAGDGHDGTWVAHPGMVALAREVFDELMPTPNQIESGKQADFVVTAADLLQVPEGDISEDGLRLNINVALQYLRAWLRGAGAVPIHNLMEDAATAEISRAQIWQWLRHGATLSGGGQVTEALVERLLNEELDALGREEHAQAAALFHEVATVRPLVDFLTLSGYRELA
ncbi:malate synthase A [Deinococcus puniceus]|uniref:Malate synthase n=1 Tax=Deinococcus puniceus TaxID=1182568 RepID=A0A172TAT7_9DEIO|nr:malate synthase A [Deinococcus puniceus]ANE44046.1 malate synthase [Deinococcus puniceus]